MDGATRTELFELTLATPDLEPGGPLTGEVVVHADREVRELRIELARTETSTKSPSPLVLVVQQTRILGAGALVPGARLPFSLTVPRVLAPAFTSAHGSVRWSVRAVADVRGTDPVAEQPVTIAPSAEVARVAPASLGAATAAATVADRPLNRMLGIVFVGIGAVFGLLGLNWAANPPDSWEESDRGGMLALVFGFAVLLVLCGGLVLLAQRRRPLDGITLTLHGDPPRAAGALWVSALNENQKTLAIGFEGAEIYRRAGSPGANTPTVHPESIFHAQWTALPPGRHELRFEVPAGAPPSYAGELISIDYRVIVARTPKPKPAKRQLTTRADVVVLPG